MSDANSPTLRHSRARELLRPTKGALSTPACLHSRDRTLRGQGAAMCRVQPCHKRLPGHKPTPRTGQQKASVARGQSQTRAVAGVPGGARAACHQQALPLLALQACVVRCSTCSQQTSLQPASQGPLSLRPPSSIQETTTLKSPLGDETGHGNKAAR